MRKFIERLTAMAAGAALAWAFAAQAATFNLFNPANGILVGNPNTYVTTAATSSNVRALWSGTCDATTFLRADGACASPAGSPGGADTQVQYNNTGAFAGDAGMTYNAGTDALTVTGDVDAGTFDGIASTDWARLSQSNTFTNSTQRIAAGGAALLRLTDTAAGANQKNFFMRSAGGTLVLQSETDGLSGVENVFSAAVNTSGEFTSLALAADAITLNGVAATDFARLSQANTFTNNNVISVGDSSANLNLANTTGRLKLFGYHASLGGAFLQARDAADTAYQSLSISAAGLVFDSQSGSLSNITFNGIAASDFARLSQSNTFTGATQQVNNATNGAGFGVTGGGASGSFFSSTEPSIGFGSFSNHPVRFYSNSVEHGSISAAGVWTLNGVAQTDFARLSQANVFTASQTASDGNSPRIQTIDTTNTVTTSIQSDDTVGVMGVNSNHDLSIITNNVARISVANSGPVSISYGTPSTTFPPLRVGNTETLNTAAMISAVNASGTSIISARDANSNSEIYIGALTDGGTALNALSTQYLDITLNGQPFAEFSPIAAFGFVDWFVPHQSFAINPAISSASSINDGNFAGQAVFIDAQPTTLTGVIPSCSAVSPSGNGGCMLFISNTDTAQNLTISHQSGSSAAANQFSLPGAASMVLGPGDGATFAYDTNTDFWRAVGDTL